MLCPNHRDALAAVACASCATQLCRDCVVVLDGQPFCANCKDEKIRAMKSGASAVAPELASSLARIGAALVDLLVMVVIMAVVLAALKWSTGWMHSPQGSEVENTLIFGGWFLYEWLSVASSGQTLGKRLFGIRIVSDNGRPLGYRAFVRPFPRHLLAWAVFMCSPGDQLDPVLYLFAALNLLSLFSKQHRTLHDRVVGTLVVTKGWQLQSLAENAEDKARSTVSTAVLAAPSRRVLAAIIDASCVLASFFACFYLYFLGSTRHWWQETRARELVMFFSCVGAWFIYESSAAGARTLGKRLLHLRVISADGEPLEVRAWLRPLPRYLIAIILWSIFPTLHWPFVLFAALNLLTLSTPRHRTFHDRVAGTLVVNSI